MCNRRKVAVFSSNIYETMTREMQHGINDAALAGGVKVIYFAIFSDTFSSKYYDQYVMYDEGDIVAFELPDLDEFDGVIRIDSSFPPFAANLQLSRISSAAYCFSM